MQLLGFHHLTAVTANAAGNLSFYTQTLGLRLVKKTVNQDDTSAYHLFYADGNASPGTDITFFDWPTKPERRGNRSVVRTGFRVASKDSLTYWSTRLHDAGLKTSDITDRDNRPTLDFDDPEGQRLSLVVDSSPQSPHPWDKSPVPAQHQLLGLGPITISVPDLAPTEAVLTNLMQMKRIREYLASPSDSTPGSTAAFVFQMSPGGPSTELHVLVEPNLPPARHGSGGVHHVAFRTPNPEQYQAWVDRLNQSRIPSSGPVNRFYFQSLYFREPGGVLFEIATDGPGFATDEPLEHLGEHLSLPPFLEPHRPQIEAGLKPL